MVRAALASKASAPAPLSARHFLIGCAPIKNAGNSPENNALDFSNRLKKACLGARFSHVCAPRITIHCLRIALRASLISNHYSPITNF
jgi:hypothetical protein